MTETRPAPAVSVMTPECVRQRQDVLLRAQVARLRQRHPFYRERWAHLRGEFTSIDDLEVLPLTTKDDLATAPLAFRLEAGDDDLEDVTWDVVYTSGSRALPTPIFQTARDFRGILAAQRQMAQIRGMGGADVIANLYPLTTLPHGAWTRANHAAAVLGAKLVVGMSGAAQEPYPVTRRLSEIMPLLDASQPTVLWGVPRFLLRVLEAAVEQELRLPSIRMLAVSGEPCSTAMASTLAALCDGVGAPGAVVSNSLGASELQCGLVECGPDSGFHNPDPEQFLFESVDERTGQHVPDGSHGALALTHLDRRGTVLVRYLLGDEVTLSHDPCPRCRRSGGRIVGYHGRTGSLVKVRGSLFDLRLLNAVIERELGARDYQVLLRNERAGDPQSAEEIVVRVADPAGGVDLARLSREVHRAVRIRPHVERAVCTDIVDVRDPDGAWKGRRFVDQRGTGQP